ncbi:MAG: regulator [Acidithiobacillales bacterium SM23_46]|jgi:two-component system response regulator QseB|nr:MAG: regulator [Acidithiobacillales bacterium SM23_46]KPL28497.1 MAG: regulator [Acidithiobacillales bacterium SM1_46]
MRVLLVEDDELLGDAIRAGLMQEHYEVEWVTDGHAAEAVLLARDFDIVLLDLNLPLRGGLEVLRRLRIDHRTVPVLVLTARDTLADRVQGLDSGADDYLVKPFDLVELYARMRALMRRHRGPHDLLHHADLVLDPQAHRVTRADQPVELTPREFALLRALLENSGRVLSRARLEELLYPQGADVGSNAIEVHVHHLRRKLGGELIQTVRGVGYLVPRGR